MNPIPKPEVSPTAPAPSTPGQHQRSYVLEVIGVLSAIGFFIGIAWAFQTQISGVVTQKEFDRLQAGQSLAEVNQLLGFDGTQEPMETTNSIRANSQDDAGELVEKQTAAPVTYVWENSSLSFVRCQFVDGRLTTMQATDLP